ncbi:MAG: hypothetical protein ABSB63_22540 [Spirochaetia bacterium]|jgi:FixJ family two-component response regulator
MTNGKARVIVVDDDEKTREIIQLLLQAFDSCKDEFRRIYAESQ